VDHLLARSGLLAVRTDDALSGAGSRFMDGNKLVPRPSEFDQLPQAGSAG